MAASLVLHLGGLRQNLPYSPEADEPLFYMSAIGIAASGDPNPGWFGHPASTVIYPMAAIAHLWHAVAHGGSLAAPDPQLPAVFLDHPAQLVLLFRLLVVSYAVLSVPLAYAIGKRLFGRPVARAGALFVAVMPTAVWHAQMVRSDSAATFFALLAMWKIIAVLDRPTVGNRVWAGLAIGLAVASRYFMLVLAVPALAVEALHFARERRGEARSAATAATVAWAAVARAAVVPVAAVTAFAVASPFVIVEWQTVLANLAYEGRVTHLGSDGLSPIGNLWWYIRHALPEAMSWPLAALAGIGIARLAWRREPAALIALSFPVALLAGASLSHLHWTRWTLQALPVLALFAADAVIAGAAWLAQRTPGEWAGHVQRALVPLAVVAAMTPALVQVVLTDIQQARPSARLVIREWLLANVPPGSTVALEWWTAPMFVEDFTGFTSERESAPPNDTGLHLIQYWRLADAGTVDALRWRGVDYVVASGSWFGPILAAGNQYPAEAAFYRDLFDRFPVVAEEGGSRTRGGPWVRVFDVR